MFDKEVISLAEYENKQLEFLTMEKQVQNMKHSLSQIKSSSNDLNKQDISVKLQSNREETQLYKNLIFSLQQLKKAIEDWELQYVLKSNVEGYVNFMKIWAKYQFVQAGDVIFSIVPKQSNNYLGIAKATAQNVGKVKVGQKAWVKVDNYPEQEFGMLVANVKTISKTPDHEGNWYVQLEFPNGLKTTYNKEVVLQQEMTGNAEIITDDLKLIERFFYQFKNIFVR